MATDLTTLFVPLLDEARMADVSANDFSLTARDGDVGLNVQYVELLGLDPTVFMIAPGEVFFVPAGATVTPADGPEVSAPLDRHLVLIHVLSTYEWAPILSATGQPIADWWALEGVALESFEAFLDGADLDALAKPRGYANGGDLRAAVLAGAAGLNVLLADEAPVVLGSLGPAVDGLYTLGLRAWATYEAGISELDAAMALATFRSLAPSLAAHPLIAAVLADVGTRDVEIHVRFVYWQPNASNAASETDKGSFVPVPNGATISLQKSNPAFDYTELVKATVAADGQAMLTAPRALLNAVDLAAGERLMFRVDLPAGTTITPQYQHAGTPRDRLQHVVWGTFSDSWLTGGRTTTDESIGDLGFLVNNPNALVGSAAQPLEYYVGVPIFLQVQYPVVYAAGADPSATFETVIRKAPKGLKVEVRDTSSAPNTLGLFRTDEHGQIWGTLTNGFDGLVGLEVLVHYEIEDRSIGLLPILGDVVEGGSAPVTTYSSNADGRNAAVIGAPLNATLGRPGGASSATALATLQVGFVTLSGTADSAFSSVHGRHAGVVHALQQLRYVHQWFHHLTSGFSLNGVDESWSAILARHRGTGVWPSGPTPQDQTYAIDLPCIRVTEALPLPKEDLFGEADQVELPTTTATKTRAWRLTLYGHDHFTMGSTLNGAPVAFDNRAQFWRLHTLWHEWTHAVVNIVLDRLANLDQHIVMVSAKDEKTSGQPYTIRLDFPDTGNGNFPISGGWSALEEAVAAVPEAALMDKATGVQPNLSPSPTAVPRYHEVFFEKAGVNTPKLLNQGLTIDLNDRTGPPVLNDQRLGLRVPLAFAWALWTALKEVGGFNTTLESTVTGGDVVNDLKDKVAYLSDAKAKAIFQALVWGPLVARRTPDIVGSPSQWNDLTTPAFGPTTFSWMQAIETQFWNTLSATDRTALKDLFGAADSPVSFYLWFSFP